MKNKLPDRYYYPAVFTYEDGKEISVVFYDIELATSGENDEDAFNSAREALGDRLAMMEEENMEIPAPTPLHTIKLQENQTVALIDVYMPSIRYENETKSVNRTVTLPAWLNAKAMELNVNFSQVLQDALKEKVKMV